MIQIFELEKYKKTASKDLPLGYKQRLSLACAVMHDPVVLFLDEPTSGIDPLTRREFWNHIYAMVQKGMTIMVTTHFMDEAEYCDRIALIYKGKAIALDTPHNLINQVGSNATMEDTFIELIKREDNDTK
jgi:ABC-2 type transport system ATP-binding protein